MTEQEIRAEETRLQDLRHDAYNAVRAAISAREPAEVLMKLRIDFENKQHEWWKFEHKVMMTKSSQSEATEADLMADLETGLTDFPNLLRILPADFPRATRFGISRKQMRGYSDHRADKYWHHLNLPLALHTYRGNSDPRAKDLMGSLLRTFDDFIGRCGGVSGANSLLEPLWMDLWTPEPQIWSIASCAYVALAYQTAGIALLGFERLIGSGQRDADITVNIAGRVTHVDVEAFHRADFSSTDDAGLKHRLRSRADEKARKKFRDLPIGEVGVVAEVCVLRGADVERQLEKPLPVEDLPNLPGRKWMALRLVGVRHPDGLRFAIMPL
jgi:hypothetical protein